MYLKNYQIVYDVVYDIVNATAYYPKLQCRIRRYIRRHIRLYDSQIRYIEKVLPVTRARITGEHANF